MQNQTKNSVAALLGVAVGDALGVPYEFKSGLEMKKNPAKDMVGYGTWNQPAGTWSDDSSLTFCLAESLCNGYDLADMAQRFVDWKEKAYWTAHRTVFDIGHTTSIAIARLEAILAKKELAALKTLKLDAQETDNGNGSLMRILPLLFHIKGMPIEQQFEIVWEVSALTHRHIRAAMSCMIYLKLAEKLLAGMDKEKAYESMVVDIVALWNVIHFSEEEKRHFDAVIKNDIRKTPYQQLRSGGYVIESIEASLWCFLQTDSYSAAVLAAVNLGHDTDTTAAICGGLAGIYYGVAGIPEFWLAKLARYEDIVDLGERLNG